MSFGIRYYSRSTGKQQAKGWIVDNNDDPVLFRNRKQAKVAHWHLVRAAQHGEWYEIVEIENAQDNGKTGQSAAGQRRA